MKRKYKSILLGTVRFLILACFLLAVLLPLYWLFITSFKTNPEINALQVTYWPQTFTTENYQKLFQTTKFGIYLKNSLIVTLSASALVLLFSLAGGYALARYRFKGKTVLLGALLVSQMIPTILLFIPMFMIFGKLRLNNTLQSLIILYTVFNTPFCLITLRGFFERIPVSLEEAAMVDGCSRKQAFFRVVMPVLFPGIVATFVFAFTGAWNELLAGIMFINSNSLKTIPVAINAFIGKYSIDWGQMSAACMIALIPTVIFFAIVQKYIVQGLTQGAVKE